MVGNQVDYWMSSMGAGPISCCSQVSAEAARQGELVWEAEETVKLVWAAK